MRRRSQAEPGGLSVGDDLTHGGGEMAHSVSLGCKHEVRVQEISAARDRLKCAESSPQRR
jgi:hypothetical protein